MGSGGTADSRKLGRGWLKRRGGAMAEPFGDAECCWVDVGMEMSEKWRASVPRVEGAAYYKTDGGARGNGAAGAVAGAGVARWSAGEAVGGAPTWGLGIRLPDGKTNIDAELAALEEAVRDARLGGHRTAVIITDSEIGAKWLLKAAKAKAPNVVEARDRIWGLLDQMEGVLVWAVRRKYNGEGDALANAGCDLPEVGKREEWGGPELAALLRGRDGTRQGGAGPGACGTEAERPAAGEQEAAGGRAVAGGLVLTERLDIPGLEAHAAEAGGKVQPMVRRLIADAKRRGCGGRVVGYAKPVGGGRSVAVGDSAQKLQRGARKAAMGGSTGLDMAGSHLALANALTKGRFGALAELCARYEHTLAALAAKTGTNRAGAKNFYLSVLNGGSIMAWRRRHDVHSTAKLTEHACRFLQQAAGLRGGIVESDPGTAEAARRRGKSPQTLVLYEAEDRSLREAMRVAEAAGWEVSLLLFDEIFIYTDGRAEGEVTSLAAEITRAVSAMWGTAVEFRA